MKRAKFSRKEGMLRMAAWNTKDQGSSSKSLVMVGLNFVQIRNPSKKGNPRLNGSNWPRPNPSPE